MQDTSAGSEGHALSRSYVEPLIRRQLIPQVEPRLISRHSCQRIFDRLDIRTALFYTVLKRFCAEFRRKVLCEREGNRMLESAVLVSNRSISCGNLQIVTTPFNNRPASPCRRQRTNTRASDCVDGERSRTKITCHASNVARNSWRREAEERRCSR